MRKLLNTLFVTNPSYYLALDGDNILLRDGDNVIGRVPSHNLESIVTFGYQGASPALMGYCSERNIAITYLNQHGRFRARLTGSSRGNVTLRKEQYRISDDESRSVEVAKNFILGKVYNNRWIIERATRDYPLRIDVERFKKVSHSLKESLLDIRNCDNLESLRGIEGQAAYMYYSVFNDLILQQNDEFYFYGRNRRPPTDKVNALLSFSYTLLAHDVAAALETVGLDSYVGFLHRDRPGRISMALDLMEEFRGIYADRFVLTLINKKQITAEDFEVKENKAVILTDEGRKKFLTYWQQKKQEQITHPFLKEKISWGLAPYSQAMLLARFIRSDVDEYPPFLWK
ncbi:type I-C CRISPR-associated endonuclease Cas1c [Enterococcus alcedinis]|uniref:CRISPR-associated endonuclease Cas1 n=1 Tax=Enterococcus alcedinis TaxID=1274384 RepID=A0A917JJ19_9ENTE|nr:type I-C CRISPR-associated endonuclease Cas1c [Enterococcus alcedinis]MBP2103229.1 CRISPR-associated protein Cas1 [Enterococcus alcedinis]GGI66780.1 CRISPR-associated endonuclease Cas1 [Enterococcus alcedinis]